VKAKGAHTALSWKQWTRRRRALNAEAGPITTGAARRTHARDHYGAATEEPRRAVTSAHPRLPLSARSQRLKRRARDAQLWPRLQALNGPIHYQVRTTLEWPKCDTRKA
jgi:hypothetical protein